MFINRPGVHPLREGGKGGGGCLGMCPVLGATHVTNHSRPKYNAGRLDNYLGIGSSIIVVDRTVTKLLPVSMVTWLPSLMPRISGATYWGEPHMVDSTVPGAKNLDKPKSAILMADLSVLSTISMFSSLRSRCTIPAATKPS